MSRLLYRLDKIESALERRKVKASIVIVQPNESQQQAIERTGPHDGAMYTLIIDTDPQPKTEAELNAEIEEIVKDLKSKGLSGE